MIVEFLLFKMYNSIALSCCNSKQKINKPPTDLLNRTTSGEMDAGMERKRGWRWWWLQLLRQKHSWKEINTETCEALLVLPSELLFQAPISNIGGKVKLFSAAFRWWIEKLFCCFKLLSWEFISIESKTTDGIRMNTYCMNHSFYWLQPNMHTSRTLLLLYIVGKMSEFTVFIKHILICYFLWDSEVCI